MPKYVPHGDICSIRAVRLPVSSRKVKQLRHFSYIFFCGGYSESEKQTNKQTQKTFKGRSWLERLKQIPAEKNKTLFELVSMSLAFPHKWNTFCPRKMQNCTVITFSPQRQTLPWLPFDQMCQMQSTWRTTHVSWPSVQRLPFGKKTPGQHFKGVQTLPSQARGIFLHVLTSPVSCC